MVTTAQRGQRGQRGRMSRLVRLDGPGPHGLRRSFAAVAAALVLAAGAAGPARAAPAEPTDKVTIVEGKITGVSSAAIEVNGRRGAITDETFLMGDGRPIALGSVRKGQDATMDLDPAGRALQIDVHGVVE